MIYYLLSLVEMNLSHMQVGTWETLPPMSSRRAYVAAATIAGTIHVFGGSDGGQAWPLDWLFRCEIA